MATSREIEMAQPHPRGISSFRPLERERGWKMRDPGNKVGNGYVRVSGSSSCRESKTNDWKIDNSTVNGVCFNAL